MTDSDSEPPLEKHDALAALRQRNFQLYSGSRIFSTLANQLLQAVLAWQIYQITGSPLSLGFLGLARFLPALGLSMVGGTVADSYDRRKIMMLCQLAPLSCAGVLIVATSGGWVSQELIYGLAVLIGMASAFEAPARTAFLPGIVTRETFANAVTVNNIFQKLGSVAGPALGGFLIAAFGITTAYAFFCLTLISAIMPLLLIHYEWVAREGQRMSLSAMKEGVAFVRKNQVLLGAMSLDMFAVIFGGAQALLPVYATNVLHHGASGFGLLTASMQVGAFVMSFVLVALPPVKKTGRTLVWSVIAFGACTAAFGLSRNFYLSLVLYGLIGATDQISVVMRQTTIQLATPDELRGRVSSVQQVFVQASTQVGAIESGFVAAISSAVFAVVSGGVGAMAIAGLVGWRMPLLYRHEASGMPTRVGGKPRPGTATPELNEEPAAAAGGS